MKYHIHTDLETGHLSLESSQVSDATPTWARELCFFLGLSSSPSLEQLDFPVSASSSLRSLPQRAARRMKEEEEHETTLENMKFCMKARPGLAQCLARVDQQSEKML